MDKISAAMKRKKNSELWKTESHSAFDTKSLKLCHNKKEMFTD